MKTYYKAGTWNAVCDVCGFQHKASDLRKRWDGLMVCTKDFETRHPQDLLRVPKEEIAVPWTRPELEVFISLALPISTEVDGLFLTDESGAFLTTES